VRMPKRMPKASEEGWEAWNRRWSAVACSEWYTRLPLSWDPRIVREKGKNPGCHVKPSQHPGTLVSLPPGGRLASDFEHNGFYKNGEFRPVNSRCDGAMSQQVFLLIRAVRVRLLEKECYAKFFFDHSKIIFTVVSINLFITCIYAVDSDRLIPDPQGTYTTLR